MIDKVAEIDLCYMQQFARFLEKLERTRTSTATRCCTTR